jgi:23S rRNA (cytosine1962-C5)-methyltransferase
LWGEVPEKIRIREDDVLFEVRLAEGQKTGFYLDQRRNRTVVAGYVVPGCRVLDVFCNTGGFGIRTGLKGAGYVRLVDVSQPALDGALENARLNGLSAVETLRADAFDYLAAAVSSGESYDMVILDPPSFTKTKGAKRGAIRGFRQLVSTALALLNPEGYLALFSCSHHVSQEDLMQISLEVSAGAGWRLMVMEQFFQDRDHPHLLNFPPSLYLKGLLLKKIP